MKDPMDWLWDRGLKKNKPEPLNEEGDMLGLHGKTVPVKTDHFHGNAHISFDSIKRGKHKQHLYKVKYEGKGGHPDTGEKEDYSHTSFMSVDHDNGRPYKYRDHPHSSKDLHTLIHKAAPRWVKLSDLEPKPANEELNEARVRHEIDKKRFDEVRSQQKAKHMRHTGTKAGGQYADAMHAYISKDGGHLVAQYYSHPDHNIPTVEHHHTKPDPKFYEFKDA